MKYLKLEECSYADLPTKVNGIYLVDGSMIVSVDNLITCHLVIPAGVTLSLKDVEAVDNRGTVTEDFALKIAAMAFERDTIPRVGE